MKDAQNRNAQNTNSNTLLTRRSVLATGTAALATGTLAMRGEARDFGPNAPPVHYPDPDIVALDKRFNQYKLGNTPILRVYHSKKMLWAEGPAWNTVGRYLLWSDIPNNVQLRRLDENGRVSVFRDPSGNSNGNTFDYRGRQISCQHATRRVVRYEHSGKLTVLAEKFDGKPFNAPNDVVVHPQDGSIWFTDPGYGSMMNYEGVKRPLELKEAVYRIEDGSGKITKVTDEIVKPNGLCFSQDYSKLYVSDTGKPKDIKVWDIVDGRKLAGRKVFASMTMELNGKMVTGGADGIRCDVDGNIWASAGWVGPGYDGVHIFTPGGDRIGQIRLPEICSNVCFGGAKRNRLFMTASTSIYAVYVETRGAHIT
jgi:gluconolactonase